MKLTKIVNYLAAGALALSMTLGSGLDVGAASGTWVKDATGWWIQYPDGSYPVNIWAHDGNAWFHFNEAGYMRTGWYKDINNIWYYLYPVVGSSEGAMLTGWYRVNNTWYYSDASGAMKTGWYKDANNVWYYLNPALGASEGAMMTGWYRINNIWYYSDASGAMKAGWILDGDKWYFADYNGVMQTGVVQVAGKVYYLNPVSDGTQGMMMTGTVTIDGKQYTFNSSGAAEGTAPTAIKKFNSNGTLVSSGSSGGSGNSQKTTSYAKMIYDDLNAYISTVESDSDVISDINFTTFSDKGTVLITISIDGDINEKTIGDVFSSFDYGHILSTFVEVKTITYKGSVSLETGNIGLVKAAFDIWLEQNKTKKLSQINEAEYYITATFSDASSTTYKVKFK